ncbi:hypothetical protein GCM10010503_34830 [Streptomyces lucensis JCM 4490]|uniref:AMIN-like domain-containing protein n=1 Tax=Streptomyces lucensis JCM 4490 TaxID=1306176 RepID=A0A918J793_9ACTN|nr:hypothetical protein [Streptomyces lucensis]GGW54911.1 hypothetical protein GCM10010503_34830 [Streptomyces lucensis JCM 4490]
MNKGRWTAVAVAALMAAGSTVLAAPTASAVGATATRAADACPTGWGSLPKRATDAAAAPHTLTGIRTGRHDCYDRMVFDVGGGTDKLSYSVEYVSTFRQDPSGTVVPVAGGAILDIHVGAAAYDADTGKPTYPGRPGKALPGVDLTGYRTFRDTKFGSSFEGVTQVGLGVRARLPFRVLRLSDRLVVDVAHTW